MFRGIWPRLAKEKWLDILRAAAEIASQPQLVAGTKLHARCRV
jgi:hypothetical protein